MYTVPKQWEEAFTVQDEQHNASTELLSNCGATSNLHKGEHTGKKEWEEFSRAFHSGAPHLQAATDTNAFWFPEG